MNISFKGEIVPSQCMHLLLLVMGCPQQPALGGKGHCRRESSNRSCEAGAFHTKKAQMFADDFSYGRAVSMKGVC